MFARQEAAISADGSIFPPTITAMEEIIKSG